MEDNENHSSQENPESNSSWGSLTITALIGWDVCKGVYWYFSGKPWSDYIQTLKYSILILLAIIALILIFGDKKK
jgi:hypothetical protein